MSWIGIISRGVSSIACRAWQGSARTSSKCFATSWSTIISTCVSTGTICRRSKTGSGKEGGRSVKNDGPKTTDREERTENNGPKTPGDRGGPKRAELDGRTENDVYEF